MSDTPTPRTDAEVVIGRIVGTDYEREWVEADFVRQLERELAAEREAREKAENRLAELDANPARCICVICGATIWLKEAMITDERGPFHPLCAVKQRAEQAEAKLNIAREAFGVIHCDISALKPEWVSQQPDGTRTFAASCRLGAAPITSVDCHVCLASSYVILSIIRVRMANTMWAYPLHHSRIRPPA